jgi:hypothetical protein
VVSHGRVAEDGEAVIKEVLDDDVEVRVLAAVAVLDEAVLFFIDAASGKMTLPLPYGPAWPTFVGLLRRPECGFSPELSF